MVASETGCVDQFERGEGRLLRMVDGTELANPLVGHGSHGRLAEVGVARVGLDAREPVEKRALSRTLITNDADLHGSIRECEGRWE